MAKIKTKLQLTQEKNKEAIEETNKQIERLGEHAGDLYRELNDIQAVFDKIRNVPHEETIKYEELKKVQSEWKHQVDLIEQEYNIAAKKGAEAGAAGIGAGIAVAAMGPTVAMGVATTFGVASTGTAIATLSGAAATNAALAWLGGGALAAGGGGMAAGEVFLGLAGPVGWAIAGAAVVASGVFIFKSRGNQKRLEDIFTLISERDTKSYSLAIVELNERIDRIREESRLLSRAIGRIETFGTDYSRMSEKEQLELGTFVNVMLSATQLLVNPIMGLQPNFSEDSYYEYLSWRDKKAVPGFANKYKKQIIFFANLLYKIGLDDTDKKLIMKSFSNNKELLETFDMKKKDWDDRIIDAAAEALVCKYKYDNVRKQQHQEFVNILASAAKRN